MGIAATGGTITYSGRYKIHTFTSDGTLTVTNGGNVEVLVVGGGGGGGRRGAGNGGAAGGGAGGLLYNAAFAVTNQAYSVTVGNGGAGATADNTTGSTGSNSVFDSLTANGGGGGGGAYQTGQGGNGGSGGGAGQGSPSQYRGLGTSLQGNDGGYSSTNHNSASGGGGASAVGGNTTQDVGGNGGVGTSHSITGTAVIYAGGGGGGGHSNVGGTGGCGGAGGHGSRQSSETGTAGTTNTGEGGGGGSYGNGFVGGSGIVVVRYLQLAVTTNAPTSVQGTTATFNGTIDALTGSTTVDVRGFCYKVSSTGDPTLSDSHVEDSAGGYGTGAYTKDMTSLSAGTTYKVRAYVTDANETVYGTTITFSTLGVVETDPCSFVNWNGILANGDLVNTGASGVLACGFCYKQGSSGDPTIADSKVSKLADATGGTVVYTDSSGLNPRSSPPYTGGYTVHRFLLADSGTALAVYGSYDVEYLVVGGGGGGGFVYGGGGGGGGFRTGTLSVTPQAYTITVGAGGIAAIDGTARNGNDSVFSTITAAGGGGGANAVGAPGAGGSGGGGAGLNESYGGNFRGAAGNTPSTSPSQGNSGGNGANTTSGVRGGGGGGGASAGGGAGTTGGGGSGGNGTSSSISGVATTYAGGGGGGVFADAATTYPGGSGGGGASAGNGVDATAGTANTGGGGGGGTQQASSPNPYRTGAAGGSGIVIVRYPSKPAITVGEFSLLMADVTKGTSYRIRAYATNSEGTFYGDSITQATPVRKVGGVSRILEIDYMEYPTDALAQAAYVSNSTANLQVYAEATIKTEGSYALKAVAAITGALNKTLTRTLTGVEYVLSIPHCDTVTFDIRAARTGSHLKIGLHDAGGTTTEITPNIAVADTWQTVTWDLSAVANTNKDAIDSIIITVVNADAANTFYLDNFKVVGSSAAENVFGWVL
jgi:hypothetical protein